MEPPTPDVLEWLQKVDVPTIVAVVVIGLLLRSCYRCLTKKNGKTMKAPGRNFRIPRDDFQENPSAYFRKLRKKAFNLQQANDPNLNHLLPQTIEPSSVRQAISHPRWDENKIDLIDGSSVLKGHIKECSKNLDQEATNFIFQEEDNESVNENDADLNKSLNKQRRHAVAAAPGEQRRSIASRSTYKDKGGKSSQNSRMQRQLCSW
ncbi:hypothetical protein POTOM_028950 [Populus tomentosa]|uniref:Uncharacterized protein n=1 Tax=Populus tomentosa TaxID=118781 RepID=A0A8X8CVB0_POPTO|nr:hypothetical protein POTOM_028950 [Populus tomentosa]